MKEFGMSTSNLAQKGSTMELFSIKTPLLDSKEAFDGTTMIRGSSL